ncbi:MAG: flagellar protein FliT [Thermacetogeniaceae bacterium]
MKVDQGVWEEARGLARRMQEVTRAIAEKVERRDIEPLLSLLGERQEICERLDELRREHGIASWVVESSDGELPESIHEASREIAGIFRSLLEEDEKIRRMMEEAMAAVRDDLIQVKMANEARRLYEGGALPLRGAFVDSRR